jgi:hypothetical protein
MRLSTVVGFVLLAAVLTTAGCGGADTTTSTTTVAPPDSQSQSARVFSHSTEITNPYLPISKFSRCVLTGTDEGPNTRVVRTLLGRTQPFPYRGKTVDAAVVRDVVTGQGQLIEKTLDYFAQDDAGTVYYFGEDVNEYDNGQLAGHEGQWRLGRNTQQPGVLMPADPRVGDTFQSEDVPGITHETDHVVAAGGTERIGAHSYGNVIRIRENAKPPPEVEFKNYSRGTGVITEANGKLHLVSCSRWA